MFVTAVQKWIENRFLILTQPLCNWLADRCVNPNIVSFLGFLISVLSGILYGAGHLFWGGIGVLLAGTCDAVDGRLARQTGRNSSIGAFLDSTLDRFGEIFIFCGLAWHFAGLSPAASGQLRTDQLMVLLTVLALTGSLMVSYIRARAEGLGLQCKVGLMQRPVRMFVLIVGSLAAALPVVGLPIMNVTIGLLAIFTNYSAWQRMHHVYGQLLKKP
jgi:CDP-diacylglycerol--glycerol-3-phosphate 3-phosphatidyltransferase